MAIAVVGQRVAERVHGAKIEAHATAPSKRRAGRGASVGARLAAPPRAIVGDLDAAARRPNHDVVDALAREVFGLLFETSSDAVFVVERASDRIVAANTRTCALLCRELGSVIGLPIGELLIERERAVSSPGRYEDVALRGADDYPVYVELGVTHVDVAPYGALAAFAARDTTERRSLQRELVAKHSALLLAHAELERAHAQLGDAKRELEARNQEIALLAWRAAMGELVAGIAHHLNNPVGALASTLRRIATLAAAPAFAAAADRAELDRQVARAAQIGRRIESNVAAILAASRSTAHADNRPPELPPELAAALSSFAEQLGDIPTKVTP